jgi:hypothetical protein
MDVTSQYESHVKQMAPLVLGEDAFTERGIYQAVLGANGTESLSNLSVDDMSVYCVINQDEAVDSAEGFYFSHIDAFSLFVKNTNKEINNYVLFSARSLVESVELEDGRVGAKSRVVKHLVQLKQIAEYYNVRIVVVNESVDGLVYLDDVFARIEKGRVYLR